MDWLRIVIDFLQEYDTISYTTMTFGRLQIGDDYYQ